MRFADRSVPRRFSFFKVFSSSLYGQTDPWYPPPRVCAIEMASATFSWISSRLSGGRMLPQGDRPLFRPFLFLELLISASEQADTDRQWRFFLFALIYFVSPFRRDFSPIFFFFHLDVPPGAEGSCAPRTVLFPHAALVFPSTFHPFPFFFLPIFFSGVQFGHPTLPFSLFSAPCSSVLPFFSLDLSFLFETTLMFPYRGNSPLAPLLS